MMRHLIEDVRGVTAIEYCLIAALISLACVIAFQSLGLSLVDTLNTLAEVMRAVN